MPPENEEREGNYNVFLIVMAALRTFSVAFPTFISLLSSTSSKSRIMLPLAQIVTTELGVDVVRECSE